MEQELGHLTNDQLVFLINIVFLMSSTYNCFTQSDVRSEQVLAS